MKFIFIQLLLLTVKLASASYPIILLPKTIYLDAEEKISITAVDQKNSEHYDFEIHDSSVHNELLYKQTFRLSPNETKILKFTLTKYPTFGKAVVSFTDYSTKKARNNILPVSKLNGITIVQSDKPIYTPKEEIKIRMLRLDKDFRPINDNLQLKIVNPQNIIMENVVFNKENQTSYFIDHYFFIPPAPILGIWKAVVYQTPEHSFNTTFEIQEYVLPTFTIDLQTTELILRSTNRLEGNVSVNYVYGRPVEGYVAFKFGHGNLNSDVEFIGKSKLKQLDHGKSNFSFDIIEFNIVSPSILFGSNKRFVVEVEVNEFVTGKKTKKLFSNGLFTATAFKFSFDETINNFKPGIENHFVGKLLFANDKVAPDVAINIDIPELNLVKRVDSNKEGYFSFTFITENNIDKVTVQMRTAQPGYGYHEQTSDSKEILKCQSTSGGYLSIRKPSKTFHVGDQFQTDFILSNIDHSQFSSFYYYLISPNGNPIESKRIRFFEKIKFRLKNEHHPRVTLVLMGYLNKNQLKDKTDLKTNDILITDSIQIDVNLPNNCDIQMRLFDESKLKDLDLKNVSTFKPGNKINLEFKSDIDQQLSLIGVDKAVYSLSSNTLLVEDKLKQIYKENSLICGLGGLTYSDHLMNSGIILFDPDNQTNHNPISSLCKGYQRLNLTKKDSKNNRIKRNAISNEASDYNYAKDEEGKRCCLLALSVSKYNSNPDFCNRKLKIIKKYMNSSKCVEAFKNCCAFKGGDISKILSLTAYANTQPDQPIEQKSPLKIKDTFVHIAEDDALERKTYIREDFREAWMFDVLPLEKNKPVNLTFELPDSITTQFLSTFALSKEKGICFFRKDPIEFITFQSLFLQVLLPYQAVQNEQLEMIITVFNYHDTNKLVVVYFYGIDGICSEVEASEKSEHKNLDIPSNSSSSVTIPLVPLKAGKFKIKVVAVSHCNDVHVCTDVVIKDLEVIPQGVSVEDEYSFQLDPKNKQKRAKRHITTERFQDQIIPEENSQFTKLKLTPNQKSRLIVPNSESCIISAIADEYGPAIAYTLPDGDPSSNEISKGSITNLNHLIRKSRGCGEQCAFYYAPTLYTLIYLESMNKLQPEQKEKGLTYLKSGYKRQLMFRKSDGSFSAFPNRKPSIWLTSFIMKLFCVSSKYIEIDPQVIKDGLGFLFSKQDINGNWNEINPVMHKQLIGGTSGRVPLTSSVLSTLRICSRIEEINLDINQELVSSIQKAENFLAFYKNDIKQSKNAYKIALLANSLIDSLSYRDESLELLSYLESIATVDSNNNIISWRDDFPIEAASLVLLSLASIESQKLSLSPKLLKNSSANNATIPAKSYFNHLRRLEADKDFIDKADNLLKKLSPQSIVNYLNSQKTFTGGYDTTQDTILALNALSEHYRNQISLEQLSMNLNCDISTLKSRFKRNLQFNNENALVMKRLQLDVDQIDQLMDEELSFTTKGNGIGFMSVKLKYNIILPEKLCPFDVTAELNEWRYIEQKKKQKKRKNHDNVVEDKSKNRSDSDEDKLDDFEQEHEEQFDEFQKMFDKNLLKELGGEFNLIGSRRRRDTSSQKDENQVVEPIKKKEEISKKDLVKEFEKLSAKADEMEELILKKIDHHFELKENNNKFHYEVIEKKREKRSFFGKFQGIGRKKDTTSSKDNQAKQKAAVDSDENIRIMPDNNNLINLKPLIDGSYAVYQLKLCIQHVPNFDSEMTIVEISLLTGFEIDKEDLLASVYDPKAKNSNIAATKLSKVEFTGRSVILYLDSVAFGRKDCYYLKLYQVSQVANLQSGMIKVYDYYKKDDTCTTLYSPTIIEHLNITCENKACTCSVNNNCPDNKRIHDLIKISERDYIQGKNKLQDLMCFDSKLNHVFVGKVIDYKLIQNNLLFKIENTRTYREKGPKLTKTVVLVFNQECTEKLDIKVSDEPYIFFLNGTSYIAIGENKENILTIYPTRRSMIYSLSKQVNKASQNNINRYLDEINKSIARGILDCKGSASL